MIVLVSVISDATLACVLRQQSARSRRTPNRGCRGNSTPAAGATPSTAAQTTPRPSRRSNKVENFEWVECVICRTWRKLPKHVKTASLPDKWDCSMNKWDPKRNRFALHSNLADELGLDLPPPISPTDIHAHKLPSFTVSNTCAPRGSCTAPQEKSEAATSAKGLHNSGGTEKKKSSSLPSYRELIQAHYRTGERVSPSLVPTHLRSSANTHPVRT